MLADKRVESESLRRRRVPPASDLSRAGLGSRLLRLCSGASTTVQDHVTFQPRVLQLLEDSTMKRLAITMTFLVLLPFTHTLLKWYCASERDGL
jgi:hypothetical protein